MARHHANRGQRWESQLSDMHALYAKTGSAYTVRCYPQMRMVNGPGGAFAVPVGEGPPDFVVVAGGRALVFDAKECSKGRWPFSKLKPHQADQFDRAEWQGACALVLLRFAQEGRNFAVRWRELEPLWSSWAKTGARPASLSAEEAASLAVWSGKNADYLDAVLLAEARAGL